MNTKHVLQKYAKTSITSSVNAQDRAWLEKARTALGKCEPKDREDILQAISHIFGSYMTPIAGTLEEIREEGVENIIDDIPDMIENMSKAADAALAALAAFRNM